MKSDVLTLAAVVFLVGTIASGFGITDVFDQEAAEPPTALQQGVVVAQNKVGQQDFSRSGLSE